MEISSTTTSPAAAAATPAGTNRTVSSDFKTFLTLLTTQLKNQDPLKPLDSTEFVAQLANFSAVEQQVKTNDVLTQIQALLGGGNGSSLSTWIGSEVRVLKDAQFDGTPIEVYVAPSAQADQAQMVVRNAVGEVVQTLPLSLENDVYHWAGVAPDGTLLAKGTYALSVESLKNGELLDSHQASIYAEVREARLEAGSVVLMFEDGTKMLADDVAAVRQPDQGTA